MPKIELILQISLTENNENSSTGFSSISHESNLQVNRIFIKALNNQEFDLWKVFLKVTHFFH